MPTGYTPYIPNRNADLSLWMDNFDSTAAAAPSVYGLTAANVLTIAAANGALQAAYTPLTSPATKSKAAVAAFNAARQSALNQIRPLAIAIAQNPGISPDDKSALGVTIPKTTRSPLPTPTTVPIVQTVAMNVGSIQLRSYDTTTPTSRSKPFGVAGLEVWQSKGTVFATDPSQCTYQQTVTKTPFTVVYDGSDSGKKSTLFCRWVSKGTLTSGGQTVPGPWSGPVNFVLP